MINHHDTGSGASPSKNFIAVSASIAVFFLAVIGALAYGLSQNNDKLSERYVELNNIHTMYAELDYSYQAAMADLEYEKGASDEMDAIIDLQKAELKARRADIFVLLKNREQLAEAQREISELQAQATFYLNQIKRLEVENTKLTTANENLTIQKEELFGRLTEQTMKNVQLTEAKAVLVSRNEKLGRTVRRSSVVRVENVQVEGFQMRFNGKVKEKRSARKVDELEVCFTALPNEVAQPGMEVFFVRIINPRGETLAIEELGSGTLDNEATGEAVRITSGTEIKYHQEEQRVCLAWSPHLAFIPGNYSVEVYNKGYLAGTGNFTLR